MIIGVHILHQPQPYFVDTILQLAQQKPTDRFIIFCKQPLQQLPVNCVQHIKVPSPQFYLSLQFWYAATLPRLIKQHGINVFITNANRLCVKTTAVQFLYVECNVETTIQHFLGKYHFKKALATASKIFTNELFVQQQLCNNWKVNETQVTNIYHALPAAPLQQVSFTVAQQLKDSFTEGYDYFIYHVDETSSLHLITLLKAFSQFKKWQKSSIKLVLLLNGQQPERLINDFKNYKYRNDVFFIDEAVAMGSMLIPCAFAMLYFSNQFATNYAIAALQHHVPVIAEQNDVNNAFFKKAFLPTAIKEHDIAAQMQAIYKDEAIREHLQQQAQQVLSVYNIDNAATNLYNAIST